MKHLYSLRAVDDTSKQIGLFRPIFIFGIVMSVLLSLAPVTSAFALNTSVSINDRSTTTTGMLNRFTFTGSWSQGNSGSAYKGNDTWTTSGTAKYTVDFSGTQIKIYGQKAPTAGTAGIKIDSGTEVTVNLYNATRTEQVLIYQSATLPAGKHSLQVRNTVAGKLLVADRVDVIENTTSPNYFGTLMTESAHASQESAKGVKVGMLELRWDYYEPTQDNKFNEEYFNDKKVEYDAMKAAGMEVTLAMGVHNAPAWVEALPNSKYVDQTGVADGSKELNVIFNKQIRAQVEQYYQKIATDFGGMDKFWAVRVTSGGAPELMYPNDGNYYAFDGNIAANNIPAGIGTKPLPGWRPATSTSGTYQGRAITTAEKKAWIDWYIGALVNVADWQMDVFNGLGFKGYYQILTPGVGATIWKYNNDIANNLPKGISGVGAVWPKVYETLDHKTNVVAYTSSVADGSGSPSNNLCAANDDSVALDSSTLAGWSGARLQARYADEYGLLKGGENPGYGGASSTSAPFYQNTTSTGMMAVALNQAESCGYQVFYWAHDKQLHNNTIANGLTRYGSEVTSVHGTAYPIPTFPQWQ